ncbi:hypothetical protein Baya_8063 [Bagarius yarrelli]|uniref:Uncharacterized protein n=1 Tax=Bagarius yarrelli TaxID=175774 RepID=A0A556U459_BAGYA|nr:hypothetical protein Baya_8063 [Bagarius yarrelli]
MWRDEAMLLSRTRDMEATPWKMYFSNSGGGQKPAVGAASVVSQTRVGPRGERSVVLHVIIHKLDRVPAKEISLDGRVHLYYALCNFIRFELFRGTRVTDKQDKNKWSGKDTLPGLMQASPILRGLSDEQLISGGEKRKKKRDNSVSLTGLPQLIKARKLRQKSQIKAAGATRRLSVRTGEKLTAGENVHLYDKYFMQTNATQDTFRLARGRGNERK